MIWLFLAGLALLLCGGLGLNAANKGHRFMSDAQALRFCALVAIALIGLTLMALAIRGWST